LDLLSAEIAKVWEVKVVWSISLSTSITISGLASGSGNVQGGPATYDSLASEFGLMMASGYREVDPACHGIGRAHDYSGDPKMMMAFAKTMDALFGLNPKKSIYYPMGLSIKDGQRVAPYALSYQFDHVHATWAMCQANPAFFRINRKAQA